MASQTQPKTRRPRALSAGVCELLLSHPDAVWLYDAGLTRLVHANPAACRAYGLSLTELQGREPLFQFEPAVRQRLAALLRQVLRDRIPERLADVDLCFDDESRLPVEVLLTWLDSAQQVMLWCRDRTDQILEFRNLGFRLRQEKEARQRAEAERERLEFLSAAGRQLAQSIDYPSTLAAVARLAVPRLAVWCVLDILVDDDTWRREAVAHQEAGKIALACELQQHGGPPAGTASALWTVAATGRGLYAEEGPAFAHDEISAHISHQMGVRSYLMAPLQARGRTLGCLTLATAERTYGPRDFELAEGLGRQAALAIDNAMLYRDCSAMAQTLERGLMLPQLPRIPGMELAIHYQPAHLDTSVGGDFYDLSETPEERWAITVGDVRGKGLPAATLTALARYTLRAAVFQGRSPVAALTLLNQALVQQEFNRRTCTAVHAWLTCRPGGAQLRLAVAGHPLPLVLRTDGQVDPVGIPGRLLGLYPHLNLQEVVVDLAPGESIVFFTDGLTEARQADDAFEEHLPGVLRQSLGLDAQGMVAFIERHVTEWQDGPMDDRAILVLKVAAHPQR